MRLLALARPLALALAWTYSAALVASAAVAPPAAQKPVPARTGTSYVDWGARRIVAHAHASPPGGARLWADVSAMGQALAYAQLRDVLFAALRTLPLGCGAGEPGPLLAGEPRWQAWAQRATAHYVTTTTTYGADGSVELDAYLPLDQGPAQLGVLWLALWQRHAGPASAGPAGEGGLTAGLDSSQAAGPTAKDGGVERPQPPVAALRPPTGFVVVAQGVGVRSVLWPRLLDGGGATLYGPATLRADVFAARGVATLHASLQDALHDPRVGERPIVVRGVDRRGTAGSDVVVADEDVATLLAQPALLRGGHVAFFVGPPHSDR